MELDKAHEEGGDADGEPPQKMINQQVEQIHVIETQMVDTVQMVTVSHHSLGNSGGQSLSVQAFPEVQESLSQGGVSQRQTVKPAEVVMDIDMAEVPECAADG